ncbi:DUF742 domain-containing protein [Streptomyces sp. L7]
MNSAPVWTSPRTKQPASCGCTAVTDGRTRPRHQLSMNAVLRGLVPAVRRDWPRRREIVALCQERGRPLVELAGTLGLHLAAVTILVSDLIDAGAAELPVPEIPGRDRELQKLLAVSAALKRNWPHAAAKAG